MIEELRNECLYGSNTNVAYSENGAKMNATTGKALLDLSFQVPQYRGVKKFSTTQNSMFLHALYENPEMFLRYLFYMRDIRGGLGERHTFRNAFNWLCDQRPEIAFNLLNLIPEYGRWDDLIYIALNANNQVISKHATQIIVDQLRSDDNTENVSLLGKWLPSVNAGKNSRNSAKKLIKLINESTDMMIHEAEYRKILSSLRNKINIVEHNIASKEYSTINYEAVPSMANIRYSRLFLKYDATRRNAYLKALQTGEAKINSSVAFPHDIWKMCVTDSTTANEMWKALPDYIGDASGVIVVRDGSGSMTSRIPNSTTRALDVASALSVYFAEKLHGEFHNKFITFSSRPQLVEFPEKMTDLFQKYTFLNRYDECSNTNIEATFDLLLNTVVHNNMKQEDIPNTVLIISDMEFDWATTNNDDKLFDVIANKWKTAGYELPKLVFWNVNSRTSAIPMTQNKNGVILVSGYSASICKMVMSDEMDPYKALVKILNTERYDPVINCVAEELSKF